MERKKYNKILELDKELVDFDFGERMLLCRCSEPDFFVELTRGNYKKSCRVTIDEKNIYTEIMNGVEIVEKRKIEDIAVISKIKKIVNDNKRKIIELSLKLFPQYGVRIDIWTHFMRGKHLTPEMQEFLGVIKSDPQLKEMIDQQRLKMQYEQKVNERQNVGQLIPADGNRRISNRQQADILQIQNSEMSRQVQNNRARIATAQNNLSSISINNNNPLNRFQNMVNEINLSTQTREKRQQQRVTNKSFTIDTTQSGREEY